MSCAHPCETVRRENAGYKRENAFQRPGGPSGHCHRSAGVLACEFSGVPPRGPRNKRAGRPGTRRRGRLRYGGSVQMHPLDFGLTMSGAIDFGLWTLDLGLTMTMSSSLNGKTLVVIGGT